MTSIGLRNQLLTTSSYDNLTYLLKTGGARGIRHLSKSIFSRNLALRPTSRSSSSYACRDVWLDYQPTVGPQCISLASIAIPRNASRDKQLKGCILSCGCHPCRLSTVMGIGTEICYTPKAIYQHLRGFITNGLSTAIQASCLRSESQQSHST